MKKRIYLSSPTMHEEEMRFVQEAFDTNWVSTVGENIDGLEKEMREYVGSKYSVALSAGTAALHMAVKLAGVKPGERVFVSSLTFSATCNPIVYENAVPVFIDSEKDTWNMSPEALRKAFEKYPDTRVVIMVHLYGTPGKLDEILEICEEHNAILIEDAAESLGATYEGKMTGTFGKYGIYSFNGNKIITTSGGGMLVGESEEDIEKARFWATQAKEPERHYEHKEIGYNYRMSNIVAGVGRGQMLHLEEHIRLKKKIYYTYKEAFKDIVDVTMNPIPEECEANYWLSCMTLKEGSQVEALDIILALEQENIESRPIWKPMHLQPVYKHNDFFTIEENGSVAENIFDRGLCLPSDIKMTEEEQNRVIEIVRNCFKEL